MIEPIVAKLESSWSSKKTCAAIFPKTEGEYFPIPQL